jgi:hypothetical protein
MRSAPGRSSLDSALDVLNALAIGAVVAVATQWIQLPTYKVRRVGEHCWLVFAVSSWVWVTLCCLDLRTVMRPEQSVFAWFVRSTPYAVLAAANVGAGLIVSARSRSAGFGLWQALEAAPYGLCCVRRGDREGAPTRLRWSKTAEQLVVELDRDVRRVRADHFAGKARRALGRVSDARRVALDAGARGGGAAALLALALALAVEERSPAQSMRSC